MTRPFLYIFTKSLGKTASHSPAHHVLWKILSWTEEGQQGRIFERDQR